MILYLGRISWKKGLDRLIESLRHVARGRLVIAGNDEEGLTAKLRALAERAGVAARVSFAGYVEGTAKEQLFNAATLLVLPSISENFGNAALEAMARGCPVVVTRDVGLAADISESGAGAVCDGDPRSLAGAIQHLIEDEGRWQAVRSRALALVNRRYGWDTVAADMARRYDEVLRGSARHA